MPKAKEGKLRTDSFNNHDNEDLMAQSLLQHQIKCAGMRHPNFNASTITVNPDRPLTDIPQPTPRYQYTLGKLLNTLDRDCAKPQSAEEASMWSLIASPELASHLDLLQLGGLINLPNQFFEPYANGESKLLTPLTQMTLLDMSDIYQVCAKYPTLTRYGFKNKLNPNIEANLDKETNTNSIVHSDVLSNGNKDSTDVSVAMPEMINDLFAPSWETILYPERFDNEVDSLTTDILPCSVAVHILKQCKTCESINYSLTIKQICQHMRSYVLSECNTHPQFEKQYRQIRLFEGHVVVAARYLGLDIEHAHKHSSASITNNRGETSSNLGQPIYMNVSSSSSLFIRYPNISSYYINGWS
ncbi:hypothetical protein [Psychrobacter sp.]|uniref:hypothetical protein n=1 Tax=Psychrobacter sp. TaxID=56811 RepID=UPI0025E4F5D2|nr:hypothetical protein [Psychrobacter sp.]